MNAGAEILPEDDLAKFILTEVVRPQLDTFLDRGIPVEARTVFVAGNQRRNGPTLGAVKRVTPLQVEIRCVGRSGKISDGTAARSPGAHFTQVHCQCRLVEWPPPAGAPLEWDLNCVVHRDGKGLYVPRSTVAVHVRPGE